jgi:hypothetical protein
VGETIDNRGRRLTRAAIEDVHGQPGEFSQIRDLRVAMPYRVVGTAFDGTTIDPNFWTATASGAGAANTQATNVLTTASGTANNGYAQVISARRARFIFAHPMIYRGIIRIPDTTIALNTRRWGAFTVGVAPAVTDGFYFELSEAGALSVVRANTGTPTSVASGSFNGDVTSYTLDTNSHAYEIHYYVMEARFYIDNVLIHTFTPTTANLSNNFSLPICWQSVNGAAGTTSGTMECWASTITRIGRDVTHPTYYRQSGTTAGVQLKYGPGAMHSIVIDNVAANSAVTLYDNTSAAAPVIWSSGSMGALTQPFNLDLHDVPYQTGLFLVIATANCDVVVIYE